MTTKPTTKDTAPYRAAAVKLLSTGAASPAEVAELAGTSRQLVNYWAGDIDWRKARAATLAKAWRNALRS